jgi:hypothetical protein
MMQSREKGFLQDIKTLNVLTWHKLIITLNEGQADNPEEKMLDNTRAFACPNSLNMAIISRSVLS